MFTSPEKNVLEFGFLPGQTVVDFGTGSGHYALALAQAVGSEGAVYGVDLNQDALVRVKNLAQDRGQRNVYVLWGNIEAPNGTSLKDGVADGVVLSNLLSLLKNIPSAINEAKRVLKSGGKICVVDWLEKVKKEDAKKLFETEELIFVKEFDAGEHHYGLIFKKA